MSLFRIALVGICGEALFTSCSDLKLESRIAVAVGMLFLGGLFLLIYTVLWLTVIERNEKYLRDNFDMSNLGSGMNTPKSYNTFDNQDHRNEEKRPILESIVHFRA
jgi:hypothetical protein